MAIEKIINIVLNDNSNVAEKNIKELDKSLNHLQGSTNGVKDSMKESSLSVLDNGGAMGLLNDATGGLAMTVKDAVEATALFAKESKISTFVQGIYATVVGASTGAMKAFRIALISTGIGALVVGLILLITNFDKVKAAVFNLIPGLKDVGEFVGNIIESITDFIGVTSEAERAFARLTEQADKSLAKNKKFLAEQGDQIDEFTKRKIEANNAYNEAIKEQGADVIALAKRQNREIAKIDDDRNAERAKKRKEAQDKIDEENKRIADKAKDARDKSIADRKKADEDADKALQEKIKKEAQATFDLSQEQMQVLIDKETETDALKEAKTDKEAEDAKNRFDRLRYEADEEIAIALKVAEEKKNIRDLEVDALAGIGNILGQLAGKNKAMQKAALIAQSAASIASIIINTNVGSSKEVASKGIFGLSTSALLYTKMALSIGSVLVATTKGLAGLGGGSAGGSPSTQQGGGASESTPPQFNITGQNPNNQLAKTIGQQQNKPIEAYVVSGNVTNAQQLDRNRITTATFGG